MKFSIERSWRDFSYRDAARAAIAELRRPSPAMRDALRSHNAPPSMLNDEECDAVIRQLIEASLVD